MPDINDGETSRPCIPAIVRSALASYRIALCFSVEVCQLTATWNEADNDEEDYDYDSDNDDDDDDDNGKVPFN